MKNLITEVGIFGYEFKPAEILWALLQGGAAFIVTYSVMPSDEETWKAFAVGLGAAVIRPVIAAIFGKAPSD